MVHGHPCDVPVSFRAVMPLIRARKGDKIIFRSDGSSEVAVEATLEADAEHESRSAADSGRVLVRVRFESGTQVHELRYDRSQVAEVIVGFRSS